jgi:hypothetical protein
LATGTAVFRVGEGPRIDRCLAAATSTEGGQLKDHNRHGVAARN